MKTFALKQAHRMFNAGLGSILALGGFLAWAAWRIQNFQPPTPTAVILTRGEVDLGVRPLGTGMAVQRDFGVDLLAAGVVPLRLDLVNRGDALVRILPEQSFLVDYHGLAHPLLTAEEARRRLTLAGLAGPTGHFPSAAEALVKTRDVTGFALSLAVRPGRAPPFNHKTGAARWLAAILGLDPHPLETRLLRGLTEHLAVNPGIGPGSAGEACLLFPSADDGSAGASLRLALARDGQVENLSLPLPVQRGMELESASADHKDALRSDSLD